MKRFFQYITLTLLACAILPGCVIVHGETRNISGAEIPAEKFAQVIPGQKVSAVVELLGEPTEKTTEDGGGQVWKWQYRKTTKGQSWFLFIPVSKDTTTMGKTYLIEFKDGAVTKAWSE